MCAVLLILMPGTPASAQDRQEQLLPQVKSAFLLNFIKYTRWPAGAFEDEESELVVVVLGDDALGRILDQTMSKDKPHGRTIRIKRLAMPARDDFRTASAYEEALDDVARELRTSHLVYYTGTNEREREWLVEAIDHGRTMTVGEGREATADGLMFGFIIEDRKLRFMVGFELVERSEISVNPRLLGLAKNKP